MDKTKPQSGQWKKFLGGLIAIGIFASFVVVGRQNEQSPATSPLKATVVETTAAPAIMSLDPASGKSGDLVNIIVSGLSDFSKGGVFFGEFKAEITKVEKVVSSKKTSSTTTTTSKDLPIAVTVKVPWIPNTGKYPVKITMPTGMIASPLDFEITEASPVPPPETTAEATPDGGAITETTQPTESSPLATDVLETTTNPEPDTTTVEEIPTATTTEPAVVIPDNPAPTEPETIPESPAAQQVLPPAVSELPTVAPVFAGEPPQNLVATVIGRGIELSWDTTNDADHFNIYYGTKSGKYIHRVTALGAPTILSSNLIDAKRYFFMVSAVTANGAESSGSNEVAAVYSAKASPQTIASGFKASAPKPVKLSEEGPAETLAIALLLALGASGWVFRRKIWARN